MGSEGNESRLRIELLGELQIQLNVKHIHQYVPAKAQALLIYLGMESRRSHSRDSLAELLWPERPPEVGRNNLRQALWLLRRHLQPDTDSPGILIADRDGIQFNSQADHAIDAVDFETLVVTADRHQHPGEQPCEECESCLVRAITLYSDGLLPNFGLPESDQFEHWLSVERERLRQLAVRALRNLAKIYVARQRHRDALKTMERLIEIEPWDEENYLSAMRLLARLGRRTAALRMFERCGAMLHKEFGIAPSSAAQELKETIASGRLSVLPADAEQAEDESAEARPIKADTEDRRKKRLYGFLASATVAIALFAAVYFGVVRSGQDEDGIQTSSPMPTLASMPVAPPFPEERAVLVSFFEQTNGESWKNAEGWLTQESHCNWFGVYCVNGKITQIALPHNGLGGALTPEIANLTELRILDLKENVIGGQIPDVLGEIQHLTRLDLSYNHFEGRIPPQLGNLAELGDLVLKGNTQLAGPIPPEIGNLRELKYLSLSSYDGGTHLSGELPPELGNLRKLHHLEICNTSITGRIPDEIGNLTELQFLDVSNNPLSGPLPDSLGNLANLRIFFSGESKNWLDGPLPLTLINLKKISIFQYHETSICEPDDPDLHAWLESVPELYRTGIPCSPPPPQ